MKQLLYTALDLRRALWVPEATGAMIVCSYKSDLLPWMRERNNEVWCFQEQFPDLTPPRTTSELLGHPNSLKWLRSLGKELKFLVFKPSNRIRQFIEKEGWELISPSVDVCRELEDKVSFFDLAQKHHLNIPKSEIVLWDEQKIEDYQNHFGDPLVVQERMGHAGSCTHILRKEVSHSWQGGGQRAQSEQGVVAPRTRVKISEFVTGPTYTFNGYVSPKGKLVASRLYQQLMDVPQWNEFEMGTVGISPELNLSHEVYELLREELLKMVPLFQEVNYSGFFGMDLIWNGKQWYVIECNPRFTASISLQCLMDVVNHQGSILKCHAERAEPEEHEFRFLSETEDHLPTPGPLQGEKTCQSSVSFGHIVLRNSKPRPWKIPRTLKSGIYRKNVEGNWEMRLRSSDAQELEEGEVLLILAQEAGAMIDVGSDFAGLQYKGSAYVDGKIDERFFDFYDRVVMGYLIRPQDFWRDKYILLEGEDRHPRHSQGENRRMQGEHRRLEGENIDSRLQVGHFAVYSKPSPTSQMSTEVLPGETIKLLGEYNDFFFIERADGTQGWMNSSIVHRPSTIDEFILPNKQSIEAESFFSHWNGKPYLFGGNSEQGIDCSAFVQRYFWEVKGVLLPKYSQDQKATCPQEVRREELQDDDLVFLRHKKTKIPHVGIYYKGKFWHAGISKGVRDQDLEDFTDEYEFEAFKRL